MRGVVALAAAISLPEMLADGSPFPQRNLIVFLTFSVILVTLVLQGLTLPPLIRALGLGGSAGQQAEEQEARRAMIEAALEHLLRARAKNRAEFAHVYDDIEKNYTARLRRSPVSGGGDSDPAHYARHRAEASWYGSSAARPCGYAMKAGSMTVCAKPATADLGEERRLGVRFTPGQAGLFRAHMINFGSSSGGAVAQLGAPDGIEEVVGSNPIGSTKVSHRYWIWRRVAPRPAFARVDFQLWSSLQP